MYVCWKTFGAGFKSWSLSRKSAKKAYELSSYYIRIMKRVLVIDDDIRIQQLLMEELKEDGYHVSIASNGNEALSLLTTDSERPDLIILDLRMPKMDGFETLGFMLKRKINLPVIIFSAYCSYKNDPLAMAADAYVVKSSDLSELKIKIHDLV